MYVFTQTHTHTYLYMYMVWSKNINHCHFCLYQCLLPFAIACQHQLQLANIGQFFWLQSITFLFGFF